MEHLPNLITLVRLFLVPMIAYCVVASDYAAAAGLFLISALSDLVDGYLARRFRLATRLGAVLDPVADKLNMFVVTVTLAWQALVPLWLAVAIVGRDVAIVGGVLAYRLRGRKLAMRPTRLSKVNTFLEFSVLLLVLLSAAGPIVAGFWLSVLFGVVLTSVVASAAQYTWLWSRGRLASRPGR